MDYGHRPASRHMTQAEAVEMIWDLVTALGTDDAIDRLLLGGKYQCIYNFLTNRRPASEAARTSCAN